MNGLGENKCFNAASALAGTNFKTATLTAPDFLDCSVSYVSAATHAHTKTNGFTLDYTISTTTNASLTHLPSAVRLN